jgi:hypothetical protein
MAVAVELMTLTQNMYTHDVVNLFRELPLSYGTPLEASVRMQRTIPATTTFQSFTTLV